MQITKLVLDNFSSYEGKTVFDFTVDKNKPIVLIGGLNGAGKTSIFTAIKIALYGPLAFGYTGNNTFYSKKIKGFINDKAFQTQPFSSGISIGIKIKKERETKHYTISRNWSIIDSKIEEEYNIYEGDTPLDYSEKILFESYILSIIPIDLFEFFLFDGEEVGTIFSSDGYNKYVKNALLTMCGIDDFEILQHFCKNYNGKVESEEEIELNERYQDLLECISETEDSINNCADTIITNEQEISSLHTLIEQREAEFVRSGGLPPEEVKKLEENEIKYDKEREHIAREIKSYFEELMPFYIMAESIPQLKQQIKYEEKASIHEYITNMISREFIDNIVSEKTTDDNGISNAIYEAIIKKFEVSNGAYDEMIFDLSKTEMGQILHLADTVTSFDSRELIRKIRKKERLVKKITSIRQKLKNALSEEDAKRYTDEIVDAKHRIEILVLESSQKITEKEELELKIQTLNSDLKTIKEKIRESTQDKHVLDLSSRISQMMERIINDSMVSIRQQLSMKIIENLQQIYRKDNLISIIEISENFKFELFQIQRFTMNELKSLIANIGFKEFIKLIGNKSIEKLCKFFALDSPDDIENKITSCDVDDEIELYKRIDLNTLSKGERQIFILALYWAIIQISGKHIPFVIDTPYARIDANHREEISSKFFPNISSQVVILSTDEEITKDYYKIIKPFIAKEYLLQNNQSENRTTVTDGYFF
ncbi:DNA sulfur modification protein DndD [Ruminococcus albus SY3]|uniref:DNA sulfur modification protein DndD n=1 Tax=Ruminococcus albus SY3 TaxID=1341156 RepID=A0A011VZC1_RUMAL|nr:AAA family ATPase [Ruminococcus albus]EXM39893.1 DNA sulfur modification protein DndD [Ruminococcus albus SY3]